MVDSEFGKTCHEHVNDFKYLGTTNNSDLLRTFQRTLKINAKEWFKEDFFL